MLIFSYVIKHISTNMNKISILKYRMNLRFTFYES
jgi:hypothetical protein